MIKVYEEPGNGREDCWLERLETLAKTPLTRFEWEEANVGHIVRELCEI